MNGLFHYHHACPYIGLPSDVDEDLIGCCCIRDVAQPAEPFQSMANDPAFVVNYDVSLDSNQALSFPTNNNESFWASGYDGAQIPNESEKDQVPDVQLHPQTPYRVGFIKPLKHLWIREEVGSDMTATPENTSVCTTTSINHILSTPHEDTQSIQDVQTSPSPSPSLSSLDDTAIGFFHFSGKLKCNHARCADRTYNRSAELRRHYTTKHASQKPEFWCSVPLCERSAATGGRPFDRKDKLKDHVRQKHRGGGLRVGTIDNSAFVGWHEA